jgi:hypothetical protein
MVDAQREKISADFASNGSQSNFAFVLGTFADPDHIAGQGVERVLIQDDLNHLTAPKTETAAYPEPMFRGVERKGTGAAFVVRGDSRLSWLALWKGYAWSGDPREQASWTFFRLLCPTRSGRHDTKVQLPVQIDGKNNVLRIQVSTCFEAKHSVLVRVLLHQRGLASRLLNTGIRRFAP